MRVKICGVCRLEDALAASQAGADAIGCLVGLDRPSPEQVTASAARAIFSVVPPFVARVLVTHKTTLGEVADLLRESGATAVQLHGDFPLVAIPALREAVPFASIIKCVHVTGDEAIAAATAGARVADAILLDTKVRGRIGGTGKTHDWSISARIVQSVDKPVILAGGLNPENVAEAIAQVRPFGVDVNSGTRATAGIKDPAKIRAFIAHATHGTR
jgi:phosphoribosylanthranilate isomerase